MYKSVIIFEEFLRKLESSHKNAGTKLEISDAKMEFWTWRCIHYSTCHRQWIEIYMRLHLKCIDFWFWIQSHNFFIFYSLFFKNKNKHVSFETAPILFKIVEFFLSFFFITLWLLQFPSSFSWIVLSFYDFSICKFSLQFFFVACIIFFMWCNFREFLHNTANKKKDKRRNVTGKSELHIFRRIRCWCFFLSRCQTIRYPPSSNYIAWEWPSNH